MSRQQRGRQEHQLSIKQLNKYKKQYKEWAINDLLTFRYPFSINNNEYRILFVKVKNSIYIEFHLGDHKYYDKVRKELDLKKGSY